MASSVFVIFLSGWGSAATGPRIVLGRRPKPLLADYISTYPVVMIHTKPATLYDRYRVLGQMPAGGSLAGVLAQASIGDIRIADPDRFGALSEGFDGAPAAVNSGRQDILVPFPPGASLAEGHVSSLRLQNKVILERLAETPRRVIFTSFSGLWTAPLYGQDAMLQETAQALAPALEKCIEQALEAGHTVVICGDDPAASLLPVMLIHPGAEGMRASDFDVSDDRAFPTVPAGYDHQFAATIAALLKLGDATTAKPLFAPILPRLTDIV